MQLCRNASDGQHDAGPADPCGRVFCIHCGKPLWMLSLEAGDSATLWHIWATIVILVSLIVGAAYLYSSPHQH